MDSISKQLDVFFDSWQKLDAQYTDFAKENGLSYTGLIVLTYIYMDKDGNCTQKTLCEKTLLPKQTINSVINGFVRKKLVTLQEMPGDRRNKRIVLTARGLELSRKTESALTKAETAAVKQLGDKEWLQLVTALDRYSTIFREEMKKI